MPQLQPEPTLSSRTELKPPAAACADSTAARNEVIADGFKLRWQRMTNAPAIAGRWVLRQLKANSIAYVHLNLTSIVRLAYLDSHPAASG
jgi:hypothetical protein